ncbi:ABC transporter substrate-binding protein [Aliikangiella marina]|uniref:ABC transporter substrate-binding protein n=1 Tax=Aliikangiella marina TaxID=1712262 RepID=A0A545TIG7_9GAMM|nr:ABC transporter substrate-binding protein [Aliikangiella marina]TQV77020.1 ABC transporter substrate-binding protein [Aliikangiella marina]
MKTVLNFKEYLILLTLVLCGNASASSIAEPILGNLQDHYIERVKHINSTLEENQAKFAQSPHDLAKFVDRSVLPLWNSEKTLRGLFGKKYWMELSSAEQQGLVKGFNDTIQRYVQEGFSLYDGQQLEFVKLKLNQKKTRALLTLKVIPNLLPEFEVNFKVAKEGNSWQLYDILIQGVSYVTLKKDSFRNQYKNQGITAVIDSIKLKNKGFIESQLGVSSSAGSLSSD